MEEKLLGSHDKIEEMKASVKEKKLEENIQQISDALVKRFSVLMVHSPFWQLLSNYHIESYYLCMLSQKLRLVTR